MRKSIIIIHGDNHVKSREELQRILRAERERGSSVERLQAAKLSRAELELSLGGNSLFGEKQTVCVEGVLSLPQSQRKKELLQMLKDATTDTGSEMTLILWEPKTATAAQLKQFPGAQVVSCKSPALLFSWLDQLGNPSKKSSVIRDLPELIHTESAPFITSMLQRQIRLLIGVIDGGTVKAPPFVIAKLRSQARAFSLQQLLQMHGNLLEVEWAQKRGTTKQSWEQALDLWILRLYS